MLERLIRGARALLAAHRLPWMRIRLAGAFGAQLYAGFRRRHRVWQIVRQKVWGVALLPLPTDLATYLAGGERQALRTNRNRCLRLGYTIRGFDPLALRGARFAIYRSRPERQGRRMEVDEGEDDAIAAAHTDRYLGVFTADGVLVAFCCCPVSGDLAVHLSFIGHPDHLEHGVMYALQTAAVERLIAESRARWLMYEGFLGQPDGIRYFLSRCGFAPMNVHWELAEAPAGGGG